MDERRRRAPRTLSVATLVLVLVGLAALAYGVRGQTADQPRPPAPATEAAAGPTPSPPPNATPPSSPSSDLTYSRPVRVVIPKIGVDSALVDLGLDAQGVMETPKQVEKAGWFRPSPPPGIPGATVLAGHVTWDRKPVVFFELGSLAPGDRVDVVREDGKTAVFEVTRIGSFPKDRFPTEDVYDEPEGSELRLITCGGKYDEEQRRYLDNTIVWARLVELRA